MYLLSIRIGDFLGNIIIALKITSQESYTQMLHKKKVWGLFLTTLYEAPKKGATLLENANKFIAN